MDQNKYRLALVLVADSSVPPHLSGFVFLAEAVVIKSETYPILLSEIYERVAQIHGSSHRAISRSIAYAISHADNIREYLGLDEKDYLFNGKVISLLALKLSEICKKAEEL